MSVDLYRELGWLPRPPADFRAQCRALAERATIEANDLVRLAGHALDEAQLRRLSAIVSALDERGASLAPLTPFTLGIVGNATLEPLAPVLIATALRHGIALRCITADYGQTMQQATSPHSTINRGSADAVLIALDHHGLPLAGVPYDEAAAAAAVSRATAFVTSLREGFRTHGGALSIVQTLARPPETEFGSLDRTIAGTPQQLIAQFNDALTASVRGVDDVVFDVAALAETVGLGSWHAPTQWNMAKFAFDGRFLPLYADHVCRLIAALRGKSRRALVLDLDNTVWGGVIGDDGLEGIVIGQGNATGEAFLDVQRTALRLRERGVVLAVSSKNTDSVARAAFIEHPEMLLRESHIAVFQANWQDKATNISGIAAELALGIDAMVFLDDNPVERGLVRSALPAVAVPELPENPALYARTLAAAGYFEAVVFSDEDRARAAFYQENARRVALREQVGDLQGYLASLAMTITFAPFDATGRSRISQLIKKSNQFNLTTRRYDEAQVAAFEHDPDVVTLQVRLTDTFGDNGMISVIIAVPRDEHSWEIDTWLMSCRVLGRGVERMVLRELLQQARERGIRRVVGRYVPTARNAMVAGHYEGLGFRALDQDADGSTTWEIDASHEVEAAPMDVDRRRFGTVTA